MNNFLFEQDPDIKLFYDIYFKLKADGITKKNLDALTKDLNLEQKEKLLQLYQTRINNLKQKLEDYKTQIPKAKQELNKQ